MRYTWATVRTRDGIVQRRTEYSPTGWAGWMAALLELGCLAALSGCPGTPAGALARRLEPANVVLSRDLDAGTVTVCSTYQADGGP